MKNRILLILIVTAFILFSVNSCKKKTAFNGNILIITLDTTRADHIGSYGYSKANTPNIDKLANGGIMFSNCYSAVPLTLPAHTSIFTGKYPPGHGIRNNGRYKLSNQANTLAEVLKKEGFTTYAVISSFVLQSKFGLDQGFDIYDDSLDSHVADTTYNSQIDAQAVYGKFSAWLEKNRRKKFFAWVHFYDPHTPYVSHNEIKNGEKKDFIKLYDGELSYMDLYIGRIIEKLKKEGIYENTLIALIGDHGEAFGEHKEFASHMVFCYEANLKVPFILFNKKLIKKSIKIKDNISIVDFMPTLLNIAGINSGSRFDGIDLGSLINGGKIKKRSLYFESMYGKEELNWAPLTGIIDGKIKYISLPKPELYDISKDPFETDNLFIKKTFLARELDAKLKKTVLSLSSGSSGTKINPGKKDLEKLKALGYISSFTSKSGRSIDPKDGIILNVRLKKISSRLKTGNLNILEKELLEMKKSKLGKKNFMVYDFLYRIYMKKKKQGNVMKILEEAIKNLPNSIPFQINYALKLMESGRYNEAITACNEIIKIDPGFTRAYKVLADIYNLKGYIEKSIDNYKKAIDTEPNNISMKITFAEKLISVKKYKEALEIYNSLIQMEEVKANSGLVFKIALFKTKYGSMENASDLFLLIEKNDPRGKYYFFHSLILAKIGDINSAKLKMKIAFEKFGEELTPKQKEIAVRQLRKWSREN